MMARWSRYDLIAIDEVGYVPAAEVGAEFLFQVIAERAERRREIGAVPWPAVTVATRDARMRVHLGRRHERATLRVLESVQHVDRTLAERADFGISEA